MRKPKISVIVPVYNSELTLTRCLDSLLAQTLSGWELILVDDGSTDKSGLICNEYAKKCLIPSETKCMIHVIHRINGGVSAARQTGIEVAQGDYVIHVDPDDWVESTMLEELYSKACQEDADMVVCDFICETVDKTIYRHQTPSSLNPQDVLIDLFGRIHGSCCNKLVKKKCIEDYNAYFPEGINYCEDVCFNMQLLIHNIKVSYLAKAFYHYIQSPSSITNNYTLSTLESQIKYVDFLSSHLPGESLPLKKAKLFVKKQVFRNRVLTNSEFQKLYPEIRKADDCGFIMRTMYNNAFKGNFFLANAILSIYTLYHKLF